MIVPDVTYDSIHHRVYEFLKNSRCPDNVVLFFFSGHGESPPNNAAFLAPSDYPLRPYLMKIACMELSQFQANWKVVLLDACRAGHAMDARFISEIQAARKEGGFYVDERQCDEDENSHEDRGYAHGIFSWALIDAIKELGENPKEQLWFRDVSDGVAKRFERKRAGPTASHRTPSCFPATRLPTGTSPSDPRILPRARRWTPQDWPRPSKTHRKCTRPIDWKRRRTNTRRSPRRSRVCRCLPSRRRRWKEACGPSTRATLYRLNHREAAEKQLELAKQLNPGSTGGRRMRRLCPGGCWSIRGRGQEVRAGHRRFQRRGESAIPAGQSRNDLAAIGAV